LPWSSWDDTYPTLSLDFIYQQNSTSAVDLILSGRDKKCVHDDEGITCLKAAAWKTKKEIGRKY
jgi:hypothetical protein